MAKKATNPKPSMQREWYCLADHWKSRILWSYYSSFSYETLD